MIGTKSTPTGTPASARRSVASSRLTGTEARLHCSRQRPVQSRYRDEGLGQLLSPRRPQDVQIAGDQIGLGDDAVGLVDPLDHLQHATRDLQIALLRLIRVGVAGL